MFCVRYALYIIFGRSPLMGKDSYYVGSLDREEESNV